MKQFRKYIAGEGLNDIVTGNRKQLKGAIWNTLGSAIYGINSFLMLAVASRVGTVEETGYFGIAFTTAQLMYIIGLLGMNHYQQTDYQEKYTFSTYAKAKILACALMVIGCVGVITLLRFTGIKAIYTITVTLLMMLNSIGEMFQSLFFQKNRLDLSGSVLFHRTLWSLVMFCVTVFATRNILIALVAQIGVNFFLTVLFALRYTSRFVSSETGKKEGFVETFRLIAECFPLFMSVLLMNVIINASKYGIEILMNDTAQGYYNMIFIPAQAINLCSQFLFKPLLNKYSIAFRENKLADVKAMLTRQLAIISGLTLICCIVSYLWGLPVLGLIYNKDLSAFKGALTLVVLGGGIFATGQLFFYILVILRLQNRIMYIYILSLLATVILTGGLVTIMGITGAAISFILTQMVVVQGYCCILKKAFKGMRALERV